jgi:hypothetical protein
MQRVKFNLVGDTFTHLTNGNKGYSVHGKESKYIEWVKDGGEATFYIDSTLPWAWIDPKPGPKYAWLLESRYITPQIVDAVKINPKQYLDAFDAIFTHNQELLAIDPKFKWCPAQGFWIKEPKIYGRGFNEILTKEEGLCDYMFSVAIENGQYETYFTEKLLDCFATGTIPVYLGAPDIGEYFNKDGIIDLTDEFYISDELYYSKMEAIKDNLEIAKKMEVLEDFIYLTYFC